MKEAYRMLPGGVPEARQIAWIHLQDLYLMKPLLGSVMNVEGSLVTPEPFNRHEKKKKPLQ